MNVWIINAYGNIPREGWRDYRSTMIARALEEAGHNTVWWVSNFVHRSKTFRSDGWQDIQVTPKYLVRIVPSTPYSKHISFERIKYENNFIENVYKEALQCAPPDLIILAEPALFVSKPILKLAKQMKVKLIVDVIDLWPELFNIILPQSLSWLGKIIFMPLYHRRANLFKNADAIIAVSEDYLALARSISSKLLMDVVYWGVDVKQFRRGLSCPTTLPDEIMKSPKKEGEVWIVYAGTLGNNYDINSILEAAKLLEVSKLSVRIIIAGDGPLKEQVISTIAKNKLYKTSYLGSLNPDVLTYLYSFCDVALSTYVAGSTVSMPIKAFDYFAAGLPVINSLGRDLGEAVLKHKAGLQYISEDPLSLFDAIKCFAEDVDLRHKFKENASNLAECYDVSVQYKKFVKVAESLLAK